MLVHGTGPGGGPPLRRLGALAAALLALSCGGAASNEASALTIRIVNGEGAGQPVEVLFSWLDERDFVIRDRRLPARPGATLASVRISLRADERGLRRAHARGIGAGGEAVSEGALAIEVGAERGQTVTLSLAAGSLRDGDGDGLPDAIDLCPDTAAARPPCPPASAGDAGATPDGRPAGDAPVAADRPAPEVAADRPAPDAAAPPDLRATPDAAAAADGGPPGDAPPADGQADRADDTRPVARTVLLVAPSTALGPGDRALKERLEGRGLAVVVSPASGGTAADARGKDLVLISHSVASATVGARFRDVAVPVLCLEEGVYGEMNMTDPRRAVGHGQSLNQTQLVVVDPAHPLAAGLAGTIEVSSGLAGMTWGVPGPEGAKVATLASDPNAATIFAYREGAMMVGLRAPARRIGWFASDAMVLQLTGNGWRLFDAAVDFALAGSP